MSLRRGSTPLRPAWANYAELGQRRLHRIDQANALTHQQLARPPLHQQRLLLGRLYRHEVHRRTGAKPGASRGLADLHGIGRVVPISLELGFNVFARHRLDLMPQRFDLARPVVRRRTGLAPDKAKRWFLEERQDP